MIVCTMGQDADAGHCRRRLSDFPRVVTLSIHAEVLKIQVDCQNLLEFEEGLLQRYDFVDSLQLLKRELMEWVELPSKGKNTPVLL